MGGYYGVQGGPTSLFLRKTFWPPQHIPLYNYVIVNGINIKFSESYWFNNRQMFMYINICFKRRTPLMFLKVVWSTADQRMSEKALFL